MVRAQQKKCSLYSECAYPALRRVVRAVRALSIKAGPIGVLKRRFSVTQETSIDSGMHHTNEHVTVWWTAEIEGIAVIGSFDPDLLIEQLARRIRM